jgi:hypothetical protein
MLVRIQREMHERGECEICKDHGTPWGPRIQRQLPKVDSLIQGALENPIYVNNDLANPQERIARKPWEALLV